MQSWCHREDEAHKVCIIHLELASQPKKKQPPKQNKKTQQHLTTWKLSQLFSVMCQAVLDALLCSTFVAKYFFYPDRQAQRKGAAMWELMLTLVIFKRGVFRSQLYCACWHSGNIIRQSFGNKKNEKEKIEQLVNMEGFRFGEVSFSKLWHQITLTWQTAM